MMCIMLQPRQRHPLPCYLHDHGRKESNHWLQDHVRAEGFAAFCHIYYSSRAWHYTKHNTITEEGWLPPSHCHCAGSEATAGSSGGCCSLDPALISARVPLRLSAEHQLSLALPSRLSQPPVQRLLRAPTQCLPPCRMWSWRTLTCRTPSRTRHRWVQTWSESSCCMLRPQSAAHRFRFPVSKSAWQHRFQKQWPMCPSVHGQAALPTVSHVCLLLTSRRPACPVCTSTPQKSLPRCMPQPPAVQVPMASEAAAPPPQQQQQQQQQQLAPLPTPAPLPMPELAPPATAAAAAAAAAPAEPPAPAPAATQPTEPPPPRSRTPIPVPGSASQAPSAAPAPALAPPATLSMPPTASPLTLVPPPPAAAAAVPPGSQGLSIPPTVPEPRPAAAPQAAAAPEPNAPAQLPALVPSLAAPLRDGIPAQPPAPAAQTPASSTDLDLGLIPAGAELPAFTPAPSPAQPARQASQPPTSLPPAAAVRPSAAAEVGPGAQIAAAALRSVLGPALGGTPVTCWRPWGVRMTHQGSAHVGAWSWPSFVGPEAVTGTLCGQPALRLQAVVVGSCRRGGRGQHEHAGHAVCMTCLEPLILYTGAATSSLAHLCIAQ